MMTTLRRSLPFHLATTLLAAGLALSACGRKEEAGGAGNKPQPGAAPVPITVAPVRTMDLQRSVRVVGSLVGLETTTISNRVTGIVSKVYVDRGARVKPNDKLLEIDPERFNLAQRVAEAVLGQTLARLGLTEVPPESFDVNQTAPVKKAQSDYDNAKMKLDRMLPLYEAKIVKEFEYLDMTTAFKSAESALEASRDEARALLAQARQNRTTVDLLTKDFRESTIVAPAGVTPDGTKIESYAVTDRRVSQGEYLREGTALFVLVADSMLKLQARVPERHLAEVKNGALLNFTVEAYPKERFVGKVHTIDPAIDPASRTFLIEALVDNTSYGGRLRPGSFVPGQVLTQTEKDRVMVPQEAITSFVGVTKIFKLDGENRVKAVNVITGQEEIIKDEKGRETRWVEVVQGDVKSGDRIALTGLTKLVDGSAVILESGRPASAETTSAVP